MSENEKKDQAASTTPPSGPGGNITPAADELTLRLQELDVESEIAEKIRTVLGATSIADLSTLTEEDLTGIGMKPVPARNLIKAVQPTSAGTVASGLMNPMSLDGVLPETPSEESWLKALRAGGVLKVEQSTIIAAVRVALARRAGLFGIPKSLAEMMEAFADANEEQVDPEFFKVRQQLARRSYAEIFEAIPGLDGSYVTDARRKKLLERIDQGLWPAIINFHEQLKSWQEAWLGAGNQMAMVSMIVAGIAGGGTAMPPGLMQPPDTGVLRDHADALADAVNRVFASTGVQVTAAMAYEASKIGETLQNPRLPAMVGAANRDQMLRMLGTAIPATYTRLETNLVRYVLAILQLKDTPAGTDEIRFLSAMYMLGSQITWNMLVDGGSTGKVTGIGGKL